jgi:hypothetical protein
VRLLKPTAAHWLQGARVLARLLWSSFRDLLPIIVVIGLFQTLLFRQGIDNAGQILFGLCLVVVGLTLFVLGLEIGLFPLGQRMAHDFARKGSVLWLLAFAFSLGFGTVLAEPALIAVAGKAAELAVEGEPGGQTDAARARYALVLRFTVALSVGLALSIGVIRILLGWPLPRLIMVGYATVMVLTLIAPREIVAVAYDSGGVTTSTITVPLTAALGVGLASSIQGRDPLVDGFGLIALAAMMPIIFVLALGILW